MAENSSCNVPRWRLAVKAPRGAPATKPAQRDKKVTVARARAPFGH
jgi:hypothetical protein